MSKLFNLKEWLTVTDAARHLSIVFGENVTEADVLQLALDGRLRLSVYLTHDVPARPVEITPIPEEMKRRPGFIFSTDHMVCVIGDEIIRVTGTLDLPMVGSERSEIEHRCCSLLNGKNLEPTDGYEVTVQNADGLYQLQERCAGPIFVDLKESDDYDERLRKCANEGYFPAKRLPEDSLLIVRTDALRQFEESINSPAPKPMEANERNSLLTIIAALCDYAAIKLQERGAATQISRFTEEIGAPVSDDTVRRVLAKIPDALGTRMK